MHGPWDDRGISEDALLILMVAAAVLLAMSVVASLSGAGTERGPDRPRASFVFETDGTDVLVTHYGGEPLDGSNVSIESETRGMLGEFNGSDGTVCATPVSNVTHGATCRVPNAAYEGLYVVWNETGGDRLILDRRPAADTPTATPTATPTVTPTSTATLTPTATPAANGTATPSETPVEGTATPTPPPNGTVPPNGTAVPNGTATPDGTSTGGTAIPTGTDTPTPTGG